MANFGAWRAAFLTALSAGLFSQCTGSDAATAGGDEPRTGCGRPFLVEGKARSATCREGGGWSQLRQPSSEGLTPREREKLVEYWTGQALMEHASVAAFARFALELLALGAPAELLSQTQAALADEIEHAMICFGLASAYAEREVRPGPLDVRGALGAFELENVIETAMLEACVGETVAAVEAQIALEHATDGDVRCALGRIAADEARHAELGWKFLGWALAQAGADVHARALHALKRAILELQENLSRPVTEQTPGTLLAHGLLSPSLKVHARRIAVEQLLVPCFRSLEAVSARASATAIASVAARC